MGGKEMRIFVGGLPHETTDRVLENAFSRFGKVLEAQIMLDRDTGRPRGFGFVTFADQRAMEDAIHDMHGRELNGRVISVNKAQPKHGAADDSGYSGYRGGGYSGGGRDYSGGDRSVSRSECFKCGRLGHWARECPSGGDSSGGGGRFYSRSKYAGGGGHGDQFGDRYGDRYMDDRYDGAGGGRYGDKDRATDSRYRGGGSHDRYDNDRYLPAGDSFPKDRYDSDRYPPAGDRFPKERNGGPDRYPQNGYGKERGGYYKEGGPRGGGGDRYGAGGGPARYEGGSYRDRPKPYDRPARGARHPPSFDDRY